VGGRESAEEEQERECVGEPEEEEEEEEGGGDAGNAYEAERDARVQRNRDAMIQMGLARKPPPPPPPPPPRVASAKRSVTRSTSRWGLALLVNQALSYTSVCGLRLLVYAALRY